MYKLDKQAQLAVVALFQKALVTMEDVSDILNTLDFVFSTEGTLLVKNPDICQLTEEEMNVALATFDKAVDA